MIEGRGKLLLLLLEVDDAVRRMIQSEKKLKKLKLLWMRLNVADP